MLKLKVLCGAFYLVIARSNHLILVFLRFVSVVCTFRRSTCMHNIFEDLFLHYFY